MDTEKLKEYNKIINEAWKILKKYANKKFDNTLWDELEEETDAVYKAHGKSPFSCEILVAVINELERISK